MLQVEPHAIRIREEKDIEILRKIALAQDREIQILVDRIAKLARRLAQLQGHEAARVQQELDLLQEILARTERAANAAISNNRSQPEVAGTESAAPAPRRGHGPRPQPELPIEEKRYELPEAERDCPECGGTLVAMGDQCEESEEITVVQRRFVVMKQRRQKYRCRCNASVVTAPGPLKLQEGARYSVEFAVEVAAGKYIDHLPLERQVRIMHREGLEIDSQTLWDQSNALARPLEPSYRELGRQVLTSGVVHADETSWRMLTQNEARWCVWGISSRQAAYYQICDSHSAATAQGLLAGYDGVLVVDGTPIYPAALPPGSGPRIANCWAHVLRKYRDVAANFPRECGEILALIGKMYDVEREARGVVSPGILEEPAEVLTLRQELRNTRSRAIVQKILEWAYAQTPLPGSGLASAIHYMLDRWRALTLFLEDPRIPLDNNPAERALRGVVLGRKNHLGSKSERGAQVTAIFYTLFESAKLCGIEPKRYVLEAALRAIRKPGTATLPQDLIT